MSKRIVIALGGNALGNTAAEQLQLVTETAKSIVDLIAAGNEVVVAHGNGPQVGMINLGLSTAAEAKAIKADMPFPECGAMSEGYIGYHLQQAIGNELACRGMDKPVATIVTQTVVSKDDPAFQNPTKPVGAFYDKETADRIGAEKGYTMVEDAGRGYRQVVPSPKPFDIVEKASIKALVDAGHVVIAVGGGGIPVNILGTEAGTGFIGCIIVGYLVGYLVKWMNSWHVVKEFKPMMPIFIIPLTGVATVSALFIFVLGKPVAKTMEVLNTLLVHLAGNSSSAIVLGLILGAMIGVDL